MAYYDYYCDKCELRFEIQASMSEDRNWVKCPTCGTAKVRYLFDGVYIPPQKSKSRRGNGGGGGGSKCGGCAGGSCATC